MSPPAFSTRPDRPAAGRARRVLAVDVGGSHVKVLVNGAARPIELSSGTRLRPADMIDGVLEATAGWDYDVVSIGFPGPVLDGRPARDPAHLGSGWVGFDFEAAFRRPVRVLNDAAMQALGSYAGGHMLFLGLGTGLGSALIIEWIVHPLELAHLPYRAGHTYEHYVGEKGLERAGRKRWRAWVREIIGLFQAAFLPDYIVVGGGNARHLAELPAGVRRGDNANAFLGGFRMWETPPT